MPRMTAGINSALTAHLETADSTLKEEGATDFWAPTHMQHLHLPCRASVPGKEPTAGELLKRREKEEARACLPQLPTHLLLS
jgi:hypothetical protein